MIIPWTLMAVWTSAVAAPERETPPCEAVLDASVFLEGEFTEHLDLVWADGRIRAVAPTGSGVAQGCRVHDAEMVTPPLVAIGQPLGLVEIELEASTRDDRFGREDPVTPWLVAADGYDPRSEVVPLARQGGVLHAVTVPTGGFVSGTASLVHLAATDRGAAAVRPRAGLVVSWRATGSAAASLATLRDLVRTARAWHGQGRPRPWLGTPWPVNTLSAVVDAVGPRPTPCGPLDPISLWVGADRAADLGSLAAFADEEGVCLGVLGGAEAWLVADDLAAVHALVVIDPMVYGAGSMDARHAQRDGAMRLAQAGVDVTFLPPDAHRIRTLRHVGGNAVREGLPWATAVSALTTVAARRTGLGDTSIRLGAPADLALWSGDPLDTSSSLLTLWHQGAPVSLDTRQDRLTERYRTTPPDRFPPQTAP